MSAWPTGALSELGVEVLDCEHKTPNAAVSGHPYIAIPEIRDGVVHVDECRKITGADLKDWTRRTKPLVGDVIITRRGRVGDSAPIPVSDAAIGQNLVLLRSSGSLVDQSFLRWAVRSPLWWDEVDRWRNVGAVFSSLNVRDIARMRIPQPPMTEQRAIAEVLGALDDKIAANRRVAFTAQQLAATLFLLHQPDETTPTSYESVADIAGGGTPSTKVPEYWGGEILWVTPTDVTGLPAPYLDSTDRTLTPEGFDACASALHQVGSILMTSRATIGAFALARRPLAVNQGFIVVNAKNPAHQWWLFHEMQTRIGDYLAHANGATFLELSRGRFKAMELDWPSDEGVFERFAAEVEPLHDRSYRAVTESRHLAHLRDTLLPPLMSGRITVRQAESLVAEAL